MTPCEKKNYGYVIGNSNLWPPSQRVYCIYITLTSFVRSLADSLPSSQLILSLSLSLSFLFFIVYKLIVVWAWPSFLRSLLFVSLWMLGELLLDKTAKSNYPHWVAFFFFFNDEYSWSKLFFLPWLHWLGGSEFFIILTKYTFFVCLWWFSCFLYTDLKTLFYKYIDIIQVLRVTND